LLEKSDTRQKNILALAYYGDAVYEALVREYLLEHINSTPAVLHQITTLVVCAHAQYEALSLIEEILTEEEQDIVKRGRNSSKATVPKSSQPKYYRAATALEALFGYLAMIEDRGRVIQLFKVIANNQLVNYIHNTSNLY